MATQLKFDQAGMPDGLPERMEALLPGIRMRAPETEKLRKVHPLNLVELKQAGLYRIVQPRRYGGYEQDFNVLVDLVTRLAGACASTAWCYGLYAAHQWLVASFPQQAQDDVWGSDPDHVVCGSYAPAGAATPAEGGYLLTGTWHFASGCDGADWAVCASILPAEGELRGPAFFLVPKADYEILDNWNVVGLAGSGSKSLVMSDTFVPRHRILTFEQTTSGNTPGSQIHANPAFRVPMLCNIPSCLAATAVGAALGAVADYIDATSHRVTRGAVKGGNNRMAEFPTIQLRVAEAAASADAAREILLRDVKERAATAHAGKEVTVADRITSRRGQAFATTLALRSVEALNASTGGNGLTLDNPIQRAWRDVNAVGRHISLNCDAVGTMYGQMVLGLEPKGQY